MNISFSLNVKWIRKRRTSDGEAADSTFTRAAFQEQEGGIGHTSTTGVVTWENLVAIEQEDHRQESEWHR
jgi:hypothetical protein